MASPDADVAAATSVFYFAIRRRTLTIGRPPYAHFSFHSAFHVNHPVAVAVTGHTNYQTRRATGGRSASNSLDATSRIVSLLIRRHRDARRRAARVGDCR